MVATLDDTKSRAIATELADLKALQELLIATEQKLLLSMSSDQDQRSELADAGITLAQAESWIAIICEKID